MAHKGRTIKRIIDDVNDVILRYSRIMSKQNHSLSREIIINPYILTNRDTSEIIKKIKDFNEGYFFISEPSVSVIKEYIDIVINEAVTVNDFFIQNHLAFDMATNLSLHTLGKELVKLEKNLQEEMDGIQPAEPKIKIPTPALIRLCKNDEGATAEQRAKELCDRCRGKNLSPGRVIKQLFQIGCNITWGTLGTDEYYRDILIENELITPQRHKDTTREAIKRELDKQAESK